MMKKLKQPLLALPELSSDSKRFVEDLQKETDRGVALVAAAFLDNALDALLRSKLIARKAVLKRLFDYPGPLSTPAAKADLAYSLGLFGPETYHNLDVIRDIRNHFSHSRTPARFDEPEVKKRCAQLDSPVLRVSDKWREILGEPRTRFIIVAITTVDVLLLRAMESKPAKPGKDPAIGRVVSV
jgi:hypothetical protein